MGLQNHREPEKADKALTLHLQTEATKTQGSGIAPFVSLKLRHDPQLFIHFVSLFSSIGHRTHGLVHAKQAL